MAAASICAGGEDTIRRPSSVSHVNYLIMCICCRPSQAQPLNKRWTLIGTERIPRMEDRDRLPYVNALISGGLSMAIPSHTVDYALIPTFNDK
ncbi:uncharacterized protein LAESUDRAFT_212621 [Laetiporus sulphureus 93-53]|uniref:Cytochrome P450 n=1 Tax=Laetiporus sulphureus 93-53 TaxID=1314785 RepID=A0A165DVT6_9APHY|nr:uncharacterized protein LAESUDRAFT_212621 [Laetiporus sulphureus 93-53]KZT05731.1 hypothetical protein LAESUDRAFT_212621 [Laetiporus sulphureus 93-53]